MKLKDFFIDYVKAGQLVMVVADDPSGAGYLTVFKGKFLDFWNDLDKYEKYYVNLCDCINGYLRIFVYDNDLFGGD